MLELDATNDDQNSDRAAVLAANAAFYRAFEKKDLSAMSLVWSQGTGSMCIHPGGPLLRGWQQVRPSWASILNNTDYLEIDIEVICLEIGTELAFLLVQESVLQVNRGRRSQATSLATNIFQKMAQKWYLISHHGSPILRSA